MPKIEHKWNSKDFPSHTLRDVLMRNKNIDEGKELCERCEGTGNEFFSMYHECTHCKGTGVKTR